MKHYYSLHFAAAYGEGAYGACTYSDATSTTCTTSAGTAGTSGSSGTLADTGTLVVLFASIACLIIFTALIVRIWRRKPALQAAQVASDDSDVRSHDPRSSNKG